MNVTDNERLLAANLRKIRELRGLSQEVVAGRLGITDGAVSHIERGERRLGVRRLLEFMRLYEISFSALVRGKLERQAPLDHSGCTPGSDRMCPECAELWSAALHNE